MSKKIAVTKVNSDDLISEITGVLEKLELNVKEIKVSQSGTIIVEFDEKIEIIEGESTEFKKLTKDDFPKVGCKKSMF